MVATGSTLYGEVQRTLAIVFLAVVGVLVTCAWTVGGESWSGVCMMRAIADAPCRDCGLTRGMLFAFTGDFADAARAHHAAIGTAALFLLQPPLRFALARWRPSGRAGFAAGALDFLTMAIALGCVR